jgi:hypothetical protein
VLVFLRGAKYGFVAVAVLRVHMQITMLQHGPMVGQAVVAMGLAG